MTGNRDKDHQNKEDQPGTANNDDQQELNEILGSITEASESEHVKPPAEPAALNQQKAQTAQEAEESVDIEGLLDQISEEAGKAKPSPRDKPGLFRRILNLFRRR